MEEWKIYRLEEIGKIVTGKTPSTKNPYNYGGDIHFITPGDLCNGNKHIVYTNRNITTSGLSSIKGSILPKGAICVSCIGNLGYTGIATMQCASNQQINSIIVNPNHNPDFIYYVIKHMWPYFKSLEGQSTALSILNKSQFSKIEIPLPNKKTQNIIASILSSLDDKIELNNRINHNLEEQARNIFLSYIDCDCVECPFSDLITVGSGGTPRTSESRFWNGDIPFFSPKDVSNSCFTLFTEKLITKDGLNNCNSSLYHENTTFITARGTVGKISLAGVSMAMNQSCFALTSKDNTPYFAYFLTERVVESLKKKANGAVFDAINSKDILQELVRVPNRDVIFQIEDRIRPYMNSIRFKSIENLYLTDTRDTLLPKLMSGELKINDLTC